MSDPFGGDPFGGPPPAGPRPGGAPPPWSPPTWTRQPPPATGPRNPLGANVFATLSPILAIPLAPVGAVLGHIGLAQTGRTGQPGRSSAIVGLTLSYYVIVLLVVGLVGWAVLPADSDPSVVAAPSASATAPASGAVPTGAPSAPGLPPKLAWPPPAGSVVAVTEEPTCQAAADVHRDLLGREVGNLSGSVRSSSEWSSAERDEMNDAADAYRRTASRMEPLIAQSPNRFVQELYGQFIAYSRTFADRVPDYTREDGNFADAAGSAYDAIDHLCKAIENGEPLEYVPRIPPITDIPAPAPTDPARQAPAVAAGMAGCQDWDALDTLSAAMYADPTQGTRYADVLIDLGRRSGDPLVLDLAAYASQYLRVAAIAPKGESYKWWGLAGSDIAWMMVWGCKAVGGG